MNLRRVGGCGRQPLIQMRLDLSPEEYQLFKTMLKSNIRIPWVLTSPEAPGIGYISESVAHLRDSRLQAYTEFKDIMDSFRSAIQVMELAEASLRASPVSASGTLCSDDRPRQSGSAPQGETQVHQDTGVSDYRLR